MTKEYDYTKCRIKTTKPLRSAVKSQPWKLEAGQLSGFGYKDADGEIWFGFINGVHFALSSILEVPVHPDLRLVKPGEGVLADLPYRPEFSQTPFYWKDFHQRHMGSGLIVEVISAYITNHREEPGLENFGILKEYLAYYINAACWSDVDPKSGKLDLLREKIKEASTVKDIREWIYNCLDIGLDPL